MPYIRHTIVSVDPGKKDALLSRLPELLDGFQSTAGLRGLRVLEAAGNRLVATASYEDKQAADAGAAKASSLLGGLSEFLTEEPSVREGEVAWRYLAEGVDNRPIMPGYARHTAVGFDPSKFDAMVAHMDSLVDTFKSIDGLRRVLVMPITGGKVTPRLQQEIGSLENRMVVTGGYDSRAQAEAAQEKTKAAWAGLAEFLTGEPRVLEGNLVYGFRKQ